MTEERIQRIAKSLLWTWNCDGDRRAADHWLETAADVADLPTEEAIARRLCKRNGNCDREVDLCPRPEDCTSWRQFEDYAKAVIEAR